MRDLRVQYVLAFAMLGVVLPYVSVFFRHAGLSSAQVGLCWAIWSVALMLSPVLVTMLADAHIDPRKLLVAGLLISGTGLFTLGYANGVAQVIAVWTAYCLTSIPILPLLDGVHFSQQRRRRERGEPPRSYPSVRAWGTIGYMLPSVLLFGFLQAGMDLRVVLMTGAAFGVLAAVQALWIEDPRPHGARGEVIDEDVPAQRRVPTLDAARAMLRPNLLVFVAALVLLLMAGSVHGAFFPIYLTERIGMDEKWIGQVSNVAVFIEIFFVFGCGTLIARWGVKNLLLVAMTVTVIRFGLLALTPNPWSAVATQALHGIFMVATGVLPQMVLDESAEDRFRHSMQGLYVMIGGAGRAVANLVAGPIAAWSLTGLYGVAALVSAAAAVLILIAFREPVHKGSPLQACPPASSAPSPVPDAA